MTYTQYVSEAAPKEQSEFNKDETENLRNLLGTLQKPISTGACSHALSSKYTTCNAFSTLELKLLSSWVIDLGTIDNMTYSLYKFNTYSPSPRSRKFSIAEGTLTTMASQGDKNKLVPHPKKCPSCSKIID